ncbi:general secretion pathway protein J [Sulfitobacter noctilucae]|uniref:prepilin-type N-terminal cleavage/methylation domain-containing protein n=1 Tax=Sulfitobacter noctilucae TaxID=1342302 RepID=UPI000468BAA6|nr:prepilin-type N-terminal cleavage/methylation domain-containing protein [Sulfitobacter noctilucae]KIN74994.1 general secretion pathway protein J [Sulfitobacter noctilucae]
MSQPQRAGDAGVSLIEVLVSLAIFAVIGVAGLAVLNTVSRTGERTEGRLERLADIDRSFVILRRDLMQMRGLTATLEAGALRFLRPVEGTAVEITYLTNEDVLLRRIDRVGTDNVDQHLLDDVASAEWKLMDRSGRWYGTWPPASATDAVRPHAAELVLNVRADGGRTEFITRLFPLAAGQGR